MNGETSLDEMVGLPYSKAVKAGGFLFVSGQVSALKEDGTKPNIEIQTAEAMESLKDILEESGLGLNSLVKCNIYLSNKKYFDAMNKVYKTFFKDVLPARLCIYGVSLYDDLDVEIDAIASTKNKW